MRALPRAEGRGCGPCQACCWALPVASEPGDPVQLRKRANKRCRHQGPGGCAVYDRRPTGCRAYRCAWLAGELAEAHRPDQLGLVLERFRLDMPGEAPWPCVLAAEVRRGAADEAAGLAVLGGFAAAGVAVILRRHRGVERVLWADPSGRWERVAAALAEGVKVRDGAPYEQCM